MYTKFALKDLISQKADLDILKKIQKSRKIYMKRRSLQETKKSEEENRRKEEDGRIRKKE